MSLAHDLPVVGTASQAGGCAGGGCGSGGCNANQATLAAKASEFPSDALLEAPEHVLSTLEKDGSRRWIKPKLSQGKWWHLRRWVAYVLMVIFIAVPHIRVFGEPLIRLDIIAREFTIFGHVFLPTDTLLVALLMLTAFVSVVFLTAVTGRAWCGWACPQTVYIEYLFRPLDRLFEGTVGKGGRPKKELSTPLQLLRFVCYVAITAVLAHTFLAYFVGTDKLAHWLFGSPFEHPVAFAVMIVTTGLLTYDFYFFREQTCMIACPYGRFQSVMLDRNSLIVAYDTNRGEPRKKGKHLPGEPVGDCVDCNQCVVVCPTGIDIRNGLQMECINCTQCIDACDAVMEKVGKPKGLVRYTSQAALDKQGYRFLRARTIIYPVILLVLITAFAFAVSTKYAFDARVLRGKGAPFTMGEAKQITNIFNLRLVNRSGQAQSYELSVLEPEDVTLEVIDPDTLQLDKGETVLVPFQLRFPGALTMGTGREDVQVQVVDSSGNQRTIEFRLLGPP